MCRPFALPLSQSRCSCKCVGRLIPAITSCYALYLSFSLLLFFLYSVMYSFFVIVYLATSPSRATRWPCPERGGKKCSIFLCASCPTTVWGHHHLSSAWPGAWCLVWGHVCTVYLLYAGAVVFVLLRVLDLLKSLMTMTK